MSITYTDTDSLSIKDLTADLSLTKSALAVVQESLREVTELLVRLVRSVDQSAESDHTIAQMSAYSLYLRILGNIKPRV